MKENNKTKIQTETEELTDEQLCEVLGGMGEYLVVLQEDKPETIDAAGAMTITAKTAGIDTQISAFSIGVSDKNGEQKADVNSIMDSFSKGNDTKR